MSKLSIKEQCERIIKSKQKVLYLYGHPGMGKTAIPQVVAKENGWYYFDYRASMRDSVDILGALYKEKMEDGTWVMDYAIPKIFYIANQQPTLIVFEELNRGVLETRNAMMQVMLEKVVGTFALNNNVFFAATGNIGEEDDCDVDDFDRAFWERLAPVKCELTYEEWYSNFAKDNVNLILNNFIKNNLEHWYVAKENSKVNTNPRSYTFFSNFIGKDTKNIQEILTDTVNYGDKYLHSSTVACFTRYLQNMSRITVNDILDNFEDVKIVLDQLNKSFLNEFLEKIKSTVDIEKLKANQIDNLIKFIDYIYDDEKAGFISYICEKYIQNEISEEYEKLENEGKDTNEVVSKIKLHKNIKKILNYYKDITIIVNEKIKEEDENNEVKEKDK